jgi:hypothetical protein
MSILSDIEHGDDPQRIVKCARNDFLAIWLQCLPYLTPDERKEFIDKMICNLKQISDVVDELL